MLFAIICHDKDDSEHVRADNRPAHLEYINSNVDKVYIAGPIMSDDNVSMIGSLLIMDMANKAEVEAFAAADPYNKAGLFKNVEITPWKKVVPSQ